MSNRTYRVGNLVQRELAFILREMKDPRIEFVTVSEVVVSGDLSHAKVFVGFLGNEEQAEIDERVVILNKASGHLRSELARRVKLRITPTLKFIYDASIVYGNKLEHLIERARAEDGQRESHEQQKTVNKKTSD